MVLVMYPNSFYPNQNKIDVKLWGKNGRSSNIEKTCVSTLVVERVDFVVKFK